MLFTRAFILASLTLLATAQTPIIAAITTTISVHSVTHQPTHVIKDREAYQTSTTTVIPIGLNCAQADRACNDVQAYVSSLAQKPEFTSAYYAIESVFPASLYSQGDEPGPNTYFHSIRTETAVPSWYTAMPKAYRSYWASVGVVERSIVSKDLMGPAPTNAPGVKVVGAALAVGAAGLALV